MIQLTGVLKGITTLGGGKNRKTGEPIPLRTVVQIEDMDTRGLYTMHTLTVPDDVAEAYRDRVGQSVAIPVRAWTAGKARIEYAYAGA